ncbi:lantibiotic dehydratase [uncultured Arthrobacter sp.]|uniref:lantibiotic dehydratase n=1 Tax=uncultured Arthrobacter sp. TaxID=114050 RepID=UPI00260E95D5|nr:lantibiotic dehydratase [uncultured Arthrobacter sp.]
MNNAILAEKVRLTTSPYWVSRVNLYPHSQLRSSEHSAADRELIEQLIREQALRNILRQPLVERLARQCELSGAHRSSFLIPVKRDVFNNRNSRLVLREHSDVPRIDGLQEWFGSWRHTAELQAQLDASYSAALDGERAVLTDWTADPDVQRSVAMTNSSLFRAVRSRAEAQGQLTKRLRKSEPSLVQYFSRSCTKVSPFSLYTGTRFHQLDVDDALVHPEGVSWTSRIELRRLFVRQAARQLVSDPVDALKVQWKIADGIRERDGVLTVRRRLWRLPAAGMKADTFIEDDVSLALDGAWRGVWAGLQTILCEPTPLDLLRDNIRQQFGWDAEQAEKLTATLAARGLLVPYFPVNEQAEDYLLQWRKYVSRFSGAAAARLTDALDATEQALVGFSAGSGAERVVTVEKVQRMWADSLEVDHLENPLVEDSYVATGANAAGEMITGWAADMETLLPLLVAQDDQRVLAAALETVFVGEYGVGGRCSDLRGFAAKAYEAFPLTQALLAGESPAESAGIADLLAARRIAADHLIELASSGNSDVAIDTAVLYRIASLIPEREWSYRRSMSVFGQTDGTQLVVNHIYGGRGRYFSRFLKDQPELVSEVLSGAFQSVAPPGERTVQMRSTLGFNANLSPLLAQEELHLTDEQSSAAASLRIEDLELVHSAAGLKLHQKRTGDPIDVLYTGFLVPHALPSDEMLLAMISGAPYFSFSELTLDLHQRLHAGTGKVIASPRITHRDLLLFRRRFAVERNLLIPDPDSLPAEAFREVNVRRRAAGIPDEVFVRPLFGRQITPVERAMSPRPQHLDFLSRLHVAGAAKRTRQLGPTLLAEEFHPHPSTEGVSTGTGRHAAELFFEISTTQGESRA